LPHVLVVEDDPLVCDVVTDCLQSDLRARVDCAHNSLDGWILIKSYQYDLALIDAMVPEIGGFQLAELAANENIGVLLTSGHPESCDQLVRFNFPHLQKPYSFDAFIDDATTILQDARENIRRVRDAAAKMRAHTEALAAAIEDSRRLVAEAKARMLTER
jgi:DNA-binding response OmpR family regulator